MPINLLARINVLAGEHEHPLERLETFLSVPYHGTAAWLRIDPDFAPLRRHPRFEQLAASD